MSKSIFKILFVLTLFPSINFANHSYNYQVQLSEVCTKEDGYLYYSDGEDLSLCKPYGLIIDKFTDNNSIAKQIGLLEGDVIFGYDGIYTLTLDALNKVFNENYSLHDHQILFETYDEENQTFLEKKVNFTIKNQSAYLIDDKKNNKQIRNADDKKVVILENDQELFVSVDTLNVRKEPNGEKIGSLTLNQKVSVWDRNNDNTWTLVNDKITGLTGWVSSKYLVKNVVKIEENINNEEIISIKDNNESQSKSNKTEKTLNNINSNNFKYDELKKFFDLYIEEAGSEWYIENKNNLVDIIFGGNAYFDNFYNPDDWWEGLDEIMFMVDQYELSKFGSLETDFSELENVVKSYIYIIGETIVSDYISKKNNGDDISANTFKLKAFYNLKTLSDSNDVIYECYDYGNDNLQYFNLGINIAKEEININWKFKNKKQQNYKTEIIDIYDPYTILDWSAPEEGKTLDIWFKNPLINDSPWMDEEGLKIRLGNSRYFPAKPKPFSLDPNELVPMDDLSEQYEFIMSNYFGLGFDKVSVHDTTMVNEERPYMSSTILDTATNSDNELTCIIRKLPSGGNEDFYWPAIDEWESDLPECDPPTMKDFEHTSSGTSKWKNCFGRSFYTDGGEQMMYVGEHNEDGKWHGKGTLCYGRGDRWQGEFVNGYQSRGTIIEIYNGKNTYWHGQWEYNKPTNVKRYPNGKIVLLKDLPEDYVYTGPCNENWKVEISAESSQIEETKTNEPPYCNKNRNLFCSAQRLVDTCSSYEDYNKQLFNNCMKGVDDIGDSLKLYGLSNNEIVSGITSCKCN